MSAPEMDQKRLKSGTTDPEAPRKLGSVSPIMGLNPKRQRK